MDLAIAATANIHNVPLLTQNIGDFAIISDLVDARTPGRSVPRASVVRAPEAASLSL